MKENMKTLCGTGHRPQDLPNKFGYNWSKDILNIQKFIIDNNITKVITGMALGFDQALAIAVIKLKNEGYKIHLEAAIPCNGQDSVWAEKYRELYKRILKRCDSKVVISDRYTKDCMQDRNKYMVDNSDIVLAFYNGKGFGGTYNCIEYAKKVGKPVVNIYTMENENKKGEEIMKFTKMYNVKNNIKLKKVNSNVILEIKTRNTEDLLDINGQIYRLEEDGYKVIIQSLKGSLLPSRALGSYTREHVNVEIGGLNDDQVIAKLSSLKGMMSHKEYVEVPTYEESYPSAFDHKIPKTDEDGKVVTQTVEKNVYLDRTYTLSMNGVGCIDDKYINFGKLFAKDKRKKYRKANKIRNKLEIVKDNKKMKDLAKSFKIPLAAVAGNRVINPDDQSYLLDGFSEESKKILNSKYEKLDDNKKAALYKFFGIKGYKVSDYENFLYSSYNIAQFVKGELDLIEKVDIEEFMDMLEMLEIPNAYDIIYDLAEKGMLVNLDNYPELKHFEIAVYYERYGSDEEDDDILD